MKRASFLLAAAFFAGVISTASSAGPVTSIGPVPRADAGLQVDVWTDRGAGSIYREGEAISVYFRAAQDCYVTVYDIATDGSIGILFPQYPDDGFVYGGMTYRLPDYYETQALRVSGPRGVEYIQAVASDDPMSPGFGMMHGRYTMDVDPVAGDPFVAMNRINGIIVPAGRSYVSATTSFFVGGLVWYPRYICRDCHAAPPPHFDPYRDVCSRYTVIVAHDYDYWWTRDYYPVRVGLIFGGPFWRFELRFGRPHRHYEYTDCAWGFGNYHPFRPPLRPYREVHWIPPHRDVHQTYERDYRPFTNRDTRLPDGGRRRDFGRTRTDINAGGLTPNDSRDRVRDANTLQRDRAFPSRQRTADDGSRTRETAIDRSRGSGAPSTDRQRGALVPQQGGRTTDQQRTGTVQPVTPSNESRMRDRSLQQRSATESATPDRGALERARGAEQQRLDAQRQRQALEQQRSLEQRQARERARSIEQSQKANDRARRVQSTESRPVERPQVSRSPESRTPRVERKPADARGNDARQGDRQPSRGTDRTRAR